MDHETSICFLLMTKTKQFDQLTYTEKIKEAEKLIEELKKEINYILWDTNADTYSTERGLIPMFGEQVKYDLVKLGLNKRDLGKFFKLVDQAMGVYHDYFPKFVRRKNRKNNVK